MNTTMYEEEIDSGSKCYKGHPIKLVAEGYGYCTEDWHGEPWQRERAPEFYAWRFSPPATNAGLASFGEEWRVSWLEGGTVAWVQRFYLYTKADVLKLILADMEAHRNLPYNEERERARLMPV